MTSLSNEVMHVQRKHAPSHPETTISGGGGRGVAVNGTWEVVDNVTDSGNDEDNDDDHDKKKTKTVRKKLRVTSVGARAQPLGCVRRSLAAVVSAQAVVALGILWWGVIATLLLRWLWFYKSVTSPLEKWLGSDMRREAEPILVGFVIVVPFVVTGVVFYRFQPSTPRLGDADTVTIVTKFRTWRRAVFCGRIDSIDIAVLMVFALVQLNTFVGKLLIDRFNGKIAKSGLLNRAGRALGMNGFYAVLLSIVLVSRRSFVHEFLHLSSERAAKYHVWCGNFGVIVLALHGVIYAYCWYMDGKLVKSLIPCFDCDPKQAYKSLRNFSGLVAQVFLVAVAVASLERMRRRYFRRFTLVHCLNVLFVATTCVHYHPAVFWFITPMITYVVYRIVSVFTRVRNRVVNACALDNSIIQLQMRRDDVGLDSPEFVPGQYVYIKVDEISKNEWHPFTISSSPSRDQTSLSLDIKVQGPFTTQLLRMVQSGSLSTVQLDGYYGTGIETSSNMVFIAGGSGMTPFLSLLEHWMLMSRQENHSVALPHRLWVVWTARDMSLLKAHMPLLDGVQHSSAWKAQVWLHWTGAGDMPNDDTHEQVAQYTVGDKTGTNHHTSVTESLSASYTLIFTAAVVGAILGMALVQVTSVFNSLWWAKRISLLSGGTLGAMSGASTILWRALPTRAGFERVGTHDVDMTAKPFPISGSTSSIAISQSRPSVDALLREIHDSATGERDIRVVVSGPSGLQQRVVDTSAAFYSPFMTVECRSFAL